MVQIQQFFLGCEMALMSLLEQVLLLIKIYREVYAGVSARYICSIETFIEKRNRLERQKNKIVKSGSDDEYWEWFNLQRNGKKQERISQE